MPVYFPSYSSALVLNSFNFTILRSVFYSKKVCVLNQNNIHFVYSFLAYVAFSSCLCREDQFVVFFSHEEYEDMLLSW